MLAAVFMTSGTTSRTAFVSLSYALILCTRVHTSQFAFKGTEPASTHSSTGALNRTIMSHVDAITV